jgi:hypothetical protein
VSLGGPIRQVAAASAAAAATVAGWISCQTLLQQWEELRLFAAAQHFSSCSQKQYARQQHMSSKEVV